MRPSHRIGSLGLVLAATAFGREVAAAPWILPKTDRGPAHVMGTGFDMRAREFREACIEGDVVDSGVPEGEVSFQKETRTDEFYQLLKGTLGGEVDFYIASARAEASYTYEITENHYQTRVIYSQLARGHQYMLRNVHLTARGAQAAATKDLDYIRAVCGDAMVAGVVPGGDLALSATFDFTDEERKKSFDASLTAKVLFITKTWTFHDSSEDVRKNGSVHIDGVQTGGDASKLDALLSEARSVTCGLENPDACSAVVQKLLAYGTASDGFAGQIAGLDYRGADTSVYSYQITSYSELGVRELTQPRTALEDLAIRSTIDLLVSTKRESEQALERANWLVAGHGRTDQKTAWGAAATQARANVLTLTNALDLCYSQPWQCEAEAARARAAVQPVDMSTLYRPYGTYDECLINQTKDSNTHTVDVLASLVNVDVSTRSDASCSQLEAALDQAGRLDLSGKQIASVRPLRGIRNLSTVIARNNMIDSLAPLLGLPTLAVLDVSSNALTTLWPMTSHRTLRELDARYNGIKQIDGLDGMTGLTRLALEGNPLAVSIPVDQMPQLHYASSTVEARCSAERRRARDLGQIDASDWSGYEGLDWAPVYDRTGFEGATVQDWLYCPAAASSY
jgi:hypothetical protein